MPPAPSTLQHADDLLLAAAALSEGFRYINAPRFAFLGSGTVLFHLGPTFLEGKQVNLNTVDALERRKNVDLPRIPDDCDLDLDMDPHKPAEMLALYQKLVGLEKLPRPPSHEAERESKRNEKAQPNQALFGFRQGRFMLSEGRDAEKELSWVMDGEDRKSHSVVFDIRARGRIHSIFDSSQDLFSREFTVDVPLRGLNGKNLGSIPVFRPMCIIFFKLIDYPRMKNGALSLQDMVDIRSFIDQTESVRVRLRTNHRHAKWFLDRTRTGIRVELLKKIEKLNDAEAVVMANWLGQKYRWKAGDKQHTAAVQSWEHFFSVFRELFGVKLPEDPGRPGREGSATTGGGPRVPPTFPTRRTASINSSRLTAPKSRRHSASLSKEGHLPPKSATEPGALSPSPSKTEEAHESPPPRSDSQKLPPKVNKSRQQPPPIQRRQKPRKPPNWGGARSLGKEVYEPRVRREWERFTEVYRT